MPEIKIKHVVSFSSEDKVHKAENILKSELYRKWKCATGDKKASIVLQFEKATQIHSIDIGNESSAFVEVLVGRSSDSVNDFQVLLVASSFMSPLESRNETHPNRVRMFGPDKLTQNIKDEKWDHVQIVCTQPFNKNISYGLCFIKFHSPPERHSEQSTEKEAKKAPARLGAFKIKYDDDDDDVDDNAVPTVSSWLAKKNKIISDSLKTVKPESPSYAASFLASTDSSTLKSQDNSLKHKVHSNDAFDAPPTKKETSVFHVNKKKVGYKDILGTNVSEESAMLVNTDEDKNVKGIFGLKKTHVTKESAQNENGSTNVKIGKVNVRKPFNQIMKKVVFVISGFVNPLRSEIRDKAIEMGAKYKGDWEGSCTHLVCAFENTPKYVQVKKKNGKIVSKDWIIDCHKKKKLLPWKKYMLGKYSRDTSEESSESDIEVTRPIQVSKDNSKLNGTKKSEDVKNTPFSVPNASSSSNSEFGSSTSNKKRKISVDDVDSETEDDDALQDYNADTDVEPDSGGDTEDEIMKVENQAMNKAKEIEDDLMSEDDSESLLCLKPDTSDLPLPSLLNLFKKRHFYLYGDFSNERLFDLQRYITAYDGIVDDYMSESTKYVVTDSQWDKSFEDALSEHEDIIFVRSKWVFKCHDEQKLIPYQSYVVIPTS